MKPNQTLAIIRKNKDALIGVLVLAMILANLIYNGNGSDEVVASSQLGTGGSIYTNVTLIITVFIMVIFVLKNINKQLILKKKKMTASIFILLTIFILTWAFILMAIVR